VPFLLFSDPADTGPAILFHSGEVLQTFEISRDVASFFMSSLFADGESFVDVVDATNFKIVGAVVGHGEDCEESKQENNDLHYVWRMN